MYTLVNTNMIVTCSSYSKTESQNPSNSYVPSNNEPTKLNLPPNQPQTAMKVTLSLDKPKTSDVVTPVVCTFPQGVPDGMLEFSLLQSTSTKAKYAQDRAIHCDTDVLSLQAENRKKDAHTLLVFEVNKDTKTATLVNAQASSQVAFKVTQNLKHASSSALQTPSANKKRVLVDTFGSAKAQKKARSQDMNRVSLTNVVGSTSIEKRLKKEFKHAAKDKDPKQAEKENRDLLLPAYDLAAQQVHEVFPLDGLVAPQEREALQGMVDAVLEQESNLEDFLAETKSPFVKFCFKQVLVDMKVVTSKKTKKGAKTKAKDQASLHDKVAVLLYLSFLVEFKNNLAVRIKSRLFAEGKFTSPVPGPILDSLLAKFSLATGKGAFVKGKVMRDKLILHLLVMSLYLFGWALDVSVTDKLCQELKMEAPSLRIYLSQVGAWSIEGGKKVAIKTPLTFKNIRTRSN